jgi:hypothetical protein
MEMTKSGLSLDLSIPDISFHDLFISLPGENGKVQSELFP